MEGRGWASQPGAEERLMTPVSTQARPRQIRKRPSGGVTSNMPDYDRARGEFSWAAARAELAGLPDGRLNIAYEAVDRHADGPFADTVALRFLSKRRALLATAALSPAELLFALPFPFIVWGADELRRYLIRRRAAAAAHPPGVRPHDDAAGSARRW